ncbi:MAG: S9 family peptidase [Parachlamydia sp.]|nr:S9 family peptidase [Parachlamydia sp.]
MRLTTSLLCLFLSISSLGHSKQYTIEQFLDTKSYGVACFTSDSREILLSSNESGVINVYALQIASGKQTQLTHSQSQAVHLLSDIPGDVDHFLCTSDQDGNELYHIYRGNRKGKLHDLTPQNNATASFHSWSHDFKSFFYKSNARDPRYMDLYEMDIATWTSKMVYQNEGGFEVDAISRDKRFFAISKIRTSNDSDLYLYDRTAKTLKHLTPHRGDVQYSPASFSPDSKILYYTTDENSDFTYLKRYDTKSGNVETAETHNWDIVSCFFSHSGRYRVILLNEDSTTVARVYDLKKGVELKLPKIGEISGVKISDDDKHMLLRVEGDRSPENLYFYHPASRHSRQLTHSLNPEINPRDLSDGEVVRYASYDGLKIPALLYKAHGLKPDEKAPALIWVHGGPGGQSTKGYHYLIQYLANHGYTVVAVNNRGSSGYGKSFFKAADLKHGEADLDDCIWAKKYLISTGFVDPERIGIIGGSYGGYMTLAALAFRPQEMAVGVDIFGVSNWIRTLKSIPPWWEAGREALYKKIGNPDTQADYLESISPLFHAHKIVKPLLVIQGANDPRVLKVESDEIVDAVRKNGVPTEYLVIDDEGHGFGKKKNAIAVGKTILDFLDKHLK